jgi:hypothetical protein
MKRNDVKRVAAPNRPPAAHYTPASVSRAIARAVEKANARREQVAGAGNHDVMLDRHPNQLLYPSRRACVTYLGWVPRRWNSATRRRT